MDLKILKELEAKQNEGRGVNVVRMVVMSLERGKIREAKSIAYHDHDKIRNYPEIEAELIRLKVLKKVFNEALGFAITREGDL